MNFLRARAAEGWASCRRHSKAFFITLAVFLALCALTHFAFLRHYSGDAAAMANDIAALGSMLEEKDVVTESGALSVGAIFLNNARVAALGLALGFVPFLFLPALLILSNAVVMGMVTAASLLLLGNPAVLAASLLPHGVIEIPMLLLAISMGLSLCMGVIRLIFRRTTTTVIFGQVSDMVWAFFLFILPLLWVASVIECYVTPLVAGLVV